MNITAAHPHGKWSAAKMMHPASHLGGFPRQVRINQLRLMLVSECRGFPDHLLLLHVPGFELQDRNVFQTELRQIHMVPRLIPEPMKSAKSQRQDRHAVPAL